MSRNGGDGAAGPGTGDGGRQPAADLARDQTPAEAGGKPDQSNVDKGNVPGPCASWSNWTCQGDPLYLCKASCQQGGQTLALTCVSSGACVCGISVVTCGPYTYAKPCDACKAAVLAGCCD